jgi:hypothetical protein
MYVDSTIVCNTTLYIFLQAKSLKSKYSACTMTTSHQPKLLQSALDLCSCQQESTANGLAAVQCERIDEIADKLEQLCTEMLQLSEVINGIKQHY